MTSLIGRWHSDAPLHSTAEAAYADKLRVELQEVQHKQATLSKEIKSLHNKVMLFIYNHFIR